MPERNAGARGADVERTRLAAPERLGDKRGGIRGDLVGGDRGDDDEIEILGADAGAVEGGLPGPGGEVAQSLVRLRAAAFANPGPREDPFLADAQRVRQRGAGEPPLGQLRGDRQHCRRPCRHGSDPGGDRPDPGTSADPRIDHLLVKH